MNPSRRKNNEWVIIDEMVLFNGNQIAIVEQNSIDLKHLKEELINAEFSYEEFRDVFAELPYLVPLAKRNGIILKNVPLFIPSKQEYKELWNEIYG